MAVFGLDFGTTYSTISVLKNNEIFLLKQQDSPYIPTYVFYYEKASDVTYGYDAESMSCDSRIAGSFFRDLKRWVGCSEKNFQSYKDKLKPTYSVELVRFGESDLDTVKLKAYNARGTYSFALPDLIASFVRCIILDAEKYFAVNCSGVICSVPAAYDSSQRSFMLECVSLSSFKCLHIINEPSAAAFSTAARLRPTDSFLLVYDFGGGTFDVSGVSVRNGTFVVRSSGGDMNLGGRDVDREFVKKIYEKISATPNYTLDISSLKEKLSASGNSIVYQLPDGKDFKPVEVTVNDLHTVALPFINRTISIMRDVYLKYVSSVTTSETRGGDSGRRKCVLLAVGGSSYLPGLKGVLEAVPFISRVVDVSDARAAVSAGCSMYSLCLASNSPMLLIDCASHYLSIPSFRCESIVLVPAGAPIPFSGKREVNLLNANANSKYSAILFEGDHVKCCLNSKVYSSQITLRDLGVNSLSSGTVGITIELDVSSVGTVTFKITGPSGTSKIIGKDRTYDFSKCSKPTRKLVDLFGYLKDRVLLNLVLTRDFASRSILTLAEKEKLYNENRTVPIQYLKNDYEHFDPTKSEVCEALMGRFVQTFLRGARVERLPL
ncbi:ORF3 [Cnidium closterovirus 1]|nr:ORF3 [Cnidium closterovirus 1]